MCRVLTNFGEVTCSTEHSLLRENLECVSSTDLKINDKLCIANLPLPVDTPNVPLYNLSTEVIESYIIPNVKYKDINAEIAFVWGIFYADGSCRKTNTWVINKQDIKLLERCMNILIKNEPNINFKIHVNKLVAKQKTRESSGDIKNFVKKYRELFYDTRKYKKVPTIILNAPLKIRQSFFMGYYYSGDQSKPALTITNKGSIGSAGLFYLMKSIGYQVSINTRKDKPETYKLTGSDPTQKMQIIPNAVKKIIDIKAEEGEYIYDIQTGNHHFSAGVGELVVHNSNYISFPHIKSPKELYEYSEKVSKEITSMFPKPMSLAFEDVVYNRFFILTKKRYMYNTCDKNGVISKKVGKKGVLLARRDNSPFIRNIYEKVIEMIFDRYDKQTVLSFILDELNKLCSNYFEHKQFIITKSVGDISNLEAVSFTNEKGVEKMKVGNYTVPSLLKDETERSKQLDKKDAVDDKDFYLKSLPGQVQLAEKMKRRGMRVDAGSRLEYVIIETEDNLKDKTSEKLESFDYFINHKDVIRIDFMYYIKLLSNPLDQVIHIAFKHKNFMLEQYKLRSFKYTVIQQLKNLFKPKFKFVEKY